MIKVAVASHDGAQISPHFGQSACFLVFEVAESQLSGPEVRANGFTAHARGECGGHGPGQADQHGHQPHGHGPVIEALRDCRAVIAGGMGRGAALELEANGIQARLAPAGLTPEAAVRAWLENHLYPAGQGGCGCGCGGH